MKSEKLGLTADEFLDDHIGRAFDYVRSGRKCPSLPDKEFIDISLKRIFRANDSGYAFLQFLDEETGRPLHRATYFDALHCSRRADVAEEVAAAIERNLARDLEADGVDFLKEFPELDGCAVYAFDGHNMAHASHDQRSPKGKHTAVNTIYGLDLHTGLTRHFAAAANNGKKHHEWPKFREVYPSFHQEVAKNARRVYNVVDMAYTDNQYWCDQKHRDGARLITRLKSSIEPTFQEPISFDRGLAVNIGVKAQYCVGLNNAGTMRVVIYVDPETGNEYSFLTTDLDLPPGLIAWLYFLRWRIEKLFDTLENKLHEPKAWASGKVAQRFQTTCMAIAHNLLFYLRHLLGRDEGITERKVEKKRQKNLRRRETAAKQAGQSLHPFLWNLPVVQLTVQFIRCFQNHLNKPRRLMDCLGRFRKSMETYL